MKRTLFQFALFAAALPALAAQPEFLLVKQISPELARDIAMASVEACRKDGHNVSAVVLGRAGNVQVALRDSLVGAVRVSGAPGGDKDKACAAAALKKVEERLEFAL